MREIKFRAWSLLDRNYVKLGDQTYMELFMKTPYTRPYIIMQYTGLKDKNGKDIYEGDIAKDPMKYPHSYTHRLGNNQIGEVFFDTCLGGWFIRTLPEYDDLAFGNFNCDKHEIIGNIYENPELLK